jgi:transposase InsO family protein
VKYAYIKRHRQKFPTAAMCKVLKVSRSGYYDWFKRGESQRCRRDRTLLGHIRRVHDQSRQHYGIVKCWKQLNAEGIACGRDRIARLRRTHGVYSQRRKRFVVTTRSKHRHWIAPNRLQRDFTATSPNRVWVGDVTFIATRSGWLYLSVLLDLYSRKVVGWSMSNSNNGQLVKDALVMAVQHRQPGQGLIHHTDRGATYAMQSYRDTLTRHGMVSSMSRKRDCWDNAVAESFFANLKNELIYWYNFRSRDEARAAIFDYIEVYYNRQRLHQTLNYQTPEQFERMSYVA